MLKKILLFTIIILFTNNVFSNTYGNITINGKVINSKTKAPLPYVTVVLKNNTAVYTDADGLFSITFDDRFSNDSLIVSYVGFTKRVLSIAKYKNIPNVVIELSPIDYGIDNVVVTADSKSPKTLLKKANYNINKNYYQGALSYVFDFKMTEKKGKASPETITSKLLLYDKSGYYRSDAAKNFQAVNYEYKNPKRSKLVTRIKDGYINIDDVLKADIVRNTDNILDIKNLTDFDFSLEHSVYQGDSVWIIVYNCKNPNITNSGSLYVKKQEGKIVINKADYAILSNYTKLTLGTISDFGISFSKNSSLTDNSDVEINYTTYYHKKNNYYFLKSIKYEISFLEKNKVTKNYFLNVEKNEINRPQKIKNRQYFVK